MKLLFIINVFKNQPQADKLAAKLGVLYPDAKVLQVSDEIVHIKNQANAGLWTYRWLKAFLDSDAELCIKVDPDMQAVRAVTTFPTADVFGDVRLLENGQKHVMGCAIGFTRAGANNVVNSGLLNDKIYTSDIYTYQQGAVKQSFQDLILNDVLRRLKIVPEHWHEVWAQYQQTPRASFAFVHPVTYF